MDYEVQEIDYEKAWKKLKDFVIKQYEDDANLDDWTSIVEYSELFIIMENIESEVKYNDK